MTEKSLETVAARKNKRMMSVQAIRDAVDKIDFARAKLASVLNELDEERIIELEFAGVLYAGRAEMAIGSYSSAIRGAITDPRCVKVHAPPAAISPPKKKGKA